MRLAHPSSLLLAAGAAATMACGTCGGAPPLEVAAVPDTALVGCRASVRLVVDGGVAPYTFTLVSGPGAVDAVTGVYAVPARSGLAVLRVTDAAGSRAEATLTLTRPPTTWVTVDDWALDTSTYSLAYGLAADAEGTLWAVGATVGALTVRVGTDAGGAWRTEDLFAPPGGTGEGLFTAAAGGPGEVVAAGSATVGGQRQALVRRRVDGGWLTADEVSADGGAVAGAVALDPAGRPFALVALLQRSEACAWLVRTSPDHGVSWLTDDTFRPGMPPGTPCAASPAAVAAVPSGQVVATGSVHDGTRWRWVARVRSTDGGWSSTDDYLYPGPGLTGAVPTGLGAGPGGELYAAGFGYDDGGVRRWVVRRAGPGALAWETVDDFAAPGHARANAVAVDAEGAVYVAGTARLDGGLEDRWLVRTWRDGGWTVADDFAYPGATGTLAYAVAVTPAGEHLVAGHAFTRLPLRWLVRKEVPVCP